jgi:hypothetical protein
MGRPPYTSTRREPLALVAAALLVLGRLASAAPPPCAQRPAGPPVAGTIVLLGEDFALPGELSRQILSSARGGDRVWIRPLSAQAPAAVDPLSSSSSGQPVEPVELDPSVPRVGDDAVLCERTRRAGCVMLTGGAYLDWYGLFMPREKRSGLGAAVLEAHRSGALLIASGAAASFLGDWAIVDRAALNRPRRNPRDASAHTLVRGLGLVTDTIIDASGAPLGGVVRLLTLAAHGPSERALYLEGPVAWITGQGTPRTSAVRGSGAALVFDLHAARWQDRSLRGGRLALLFEGDRWDERERSVPTAARGLDPGAPELRVAPSVGSTLDAGLLRSELVRSFSPSRRSSATFRAPSIELSLRSDSASGFGQVAGEKPAARAGIAFELSWDAPSGS